MNLRSSIPRVLDASFSDSAERQAYELEVEEARARQTVPFAVAPRVDLRTLRGLLGPGTEVGHEDLEGLDGRRATWHLATLIAEGRVLERY